MSHSLADQLDLLIRSRIPILWIRSLEEERVESLLEQTARRLGGRTLLRWDFVSGLRGAPNREGEAARNPMAALDALAPLGPEQGALLLLKDFHRYGDDAGICRRLRNLATSLRQVPHTLVISAPDWRLPPELEDCITLLELPLPDADEIGSLLSSIAAASGQPLPQPVLAELTAACHGLSEQRVRQVAARALARRAAMSSATSWVASGVITTNPDVIGSCRSTSHKASRMASDESHHRSWKSRPCCFKESGQGCFALARIATATAAGSLASTRSSWAAISGVDKLIVWCPCAAPASSVSARGRVHW